MVSTRRLATLLAVGLGLIAVGCGDDDADGADVDASGSSTTALVIDSTTSTLGKPPPGVVPEGALTESALPPIVLDEDAAPQDRLAALAETALEYDMPELADALADGEVTAAERRQAYQDALDCMVEQGMEVLQFEEYEGLYGTKFTFVIGWGSLSQEDATRASNECEHRYVSFLEHFAYPIVSAQRFTERTRAVLQECLAEFGVTDDVGYTLGELAEVAPSQEVRLECTARAENTPRPPPEVMAGGPAGPSGR